MILPRDDFAVCVDASLKEVEARRAVVVVRHILLARPEQLDGHANLFGDIRGFDHVVVRQAPAEAAADAGEMDGDVLAVDAEDPGGLLHAARGRLAGRPDFEFAVVVIRRAVLRLERHVGKERIRVLRLDNMRRGAKGCIGVAVLAQDLAGLILRELHRCVGVELAALLRRWTVIPGDLEVVVRA